MLSDVVARIESRLSALKKTAASASKEAGLSVDAIRNMQRAAKEPETRQGVSTRTITALAPVLETSVDWLLNGDGDETVRGLHPMLEDRPPGDPVNLADLRAYITKAQDRPKPVLGRGKVIERKIPVVGEVAAGIWKAAPVREMHNIEEWLSIDVDGYERAQLRAWKLIGPSMNLVYPPGRFVVTAHPIEAGLRIGDYVIVQQMRAGLAEITCKEFSVNDEGRMLLMPRSNDPEFQDPIFLKGGDELDQSAPEIVGVVVADYGKRNRPAVAFARAATWAE